MKTSENIVVVKSKRFALEVIATYKKLVSERKEYVLSKQFLRSGTSIGANIREAQRGQSKADFIAKMSISLKEADESAYWLELLHESGYLDPQEFKMLYALCDELIRILVSITKHC